MRKVIAALVIVVALLILALRQRPNQTPIPAGAKPTPGISEPPPVLTAGPESAPQLAKAEDPELPVDYHEPSAEELGLENLESAQNHLKALVAEEKSQEGRPTPAQVEARRKAMAEVAERLQDLRKAQAAAGPKENE